MLDDFSTKLGTHEIKLFIMEASKQFERAR